MAYLTRTIVKGDTLIAIANKFGCLWQDIAKLNNLEYPFIVDSLADKGEKALKTIGDILYIPSTNVVPNYLIQNKAELDIALFGKDISLETRSTYQYDDMDINGEMTAMYSSGDLDVKQGLANLKQALTNRLSTSYGELPLHPEYGSRVKDFIGKVGTDNLIKLRLEVISTLKRDFRVKKILSLKVTADNRVVTIDADVLPIDPYPKMNFNTEITL